MMSEFVIVTDTHLGRKNHNQFWADLTEYLFDEINIVGANGILNIMKEFEMISGEVVKQPVEKMEGQYRFHSNLRCNRGGLMWIKHEPGELIKKGETAIEITNLYGNVIEEVKMPVTGYCWSYTGGINGTHAVPEGNDLAYVFYKKDWAKCC